MSAMNVKEGPNAGFRVVSKTASGFVARGSLGAKRVELLMTYGSLLSEIILDAKTRSWTYKDSQVKRVSKRAQLAHERRHDRVS